MRYPGWWAARGDGAFTAVVVRDVHQLEDVCLQRAGPSRVASSHVMHVMYCMQCM